MTPAEAERLYNAVMLAAPMAAIGAVLFALVWLWPVRRKP